jgi:hypothetical protein
MVVALPRFVLHKSMFTGKVDFFQGLTNGCMTDTENDSHFFLRQPLICFYKLAKSLPISDLSTMTFLI